MVGFRGPLRQGTLFRGIALAMLIDGGIPGNRDIRRKDIPWRCERKPSELTTSQMNILRKAGALKLPECQGTDSFTGKLRLERGEGGPQNPFENSENTELGKIPPEREFFCGAR